MAIIYSYPDNLNILLTDMLIGTSTVRIAGRKKNLTKNFTVEALGNFISLNNPTVWGAIDGNLENQTDLWEALNSKQGNITLTTIGSSGASTLIDNVLNIPQYSTDSDIPTLDEVLTVGNTSNKSIVLNHVPSMGSLPWISSLNGRSLDIEWNSIIGDDYYYASYAGNSMSLSANESNIDKLFEIALDYLKINYSDGIINSYIQIEPANITLGNGKTGQIRINDITEDIVLEFPNKEIGTYTIATTDDIPILSGYVPYTGAIQDVDLGLFDITASHLIKDGGVSSQFLKADGSVDNNIYLTSADLPSTLDLFATTTPDTLIPGYVVLVRNILDSRYNTVAVNVSTGAITTANQLLSSLITDTNVISGNPGVFNFTTIGNIRRVSGSGEATFYFRIYKRDSSGVETFITQSDNTIPVIDGGTYVEFSTVALWNDGIFLSTDRIVLKFYANRISGGSNPTYQFQFGGITPVRSTAAIPVAVLPNIYLSDLADVEDVAPLNNEILYWNEADSLWEHSSVIDLLEPASSIQDGYLTSSDWSTFNNKFDLPALTSGSVLFSNGTTIAENNTNFFWNNASNTLVLNKPSVQGASLTANGIISAGTISLVPANGTISMGTITAAAVSGSAIFFGNAQNLLHLRTASTTRLYINQTGDIGIGTTTPSATSKVNIDLGTFSGTKDGIAVDGSIGSNPGNTGIRFSLLNSSANASGSIKITRASGTSYLGMQISSQSRDGIAFLTDTVTVTEKMRLTASGDLGIGLANPAAKLHVNGLQIFQGTTLSDTAPLGAELAAVTGTGTNWTLAGTNLNVGGYTHTIGSTTPLTTALAAVIGTYYQITYTITGRTAGSITIGYGGTSTSGITATGNTGPLATTTGILSITPTTDFDGTVVLSIKTIGNSSATTSFLNSAGVVANELRANSSNSNVFLGIAAGRRNTTGNGNSFIGNSAGQTNTTGNSNFFAGSTAGFLNTIGFANTFVGANAGLNNTTGNANSFLGLNAGLNNTIGGNNTFIGLSAGRYIANGSTSSTIQYNSIMLGINTKPLADNQSNQIVIGNDVAGLGSNTTVLGNSSTVTTAIYGNLLLGTTTPNGAKLHIAGSVTAASAIARGQLLAPTLVAAANNDVLVGLDIAPTFTNGAFTGVTNYGARVKGGIIPLTNGTDDLGTFTSQFLTVWSGTLRAISNGILRWGAGGSYSFNNSSAIIAQFQPTTGNFLLQNGGTFTDVPSSRLTINSTTQGFLPPRMTNAERLAIASPAIGLMVYCTDTIEGLYINKSTGWTFII